MPSDVDRPREAAHAPSAVASRSGKENLAGRLPASPSSTLPSIYLFATPLAVLRSGGCDYERSPRSPPGKTSPQLMTAGRPQEH